jgi:hypothetical protein
MTYYEELGVPPTASADEIRHAYRRLVRLLHPDQCGDEEMRRLADLQMKRLNAMLAVLCDENQRAAYDSACSAVPIPRPPVAIGEIQRHREIAATLALASLILLALALWPRGKAISQSAAVPQPTSAPHAPAPKRTPRERQHTLAHSFRPAMPPDVKPLAINPPAIAPGVAIEPALPAEPTPIAPALPEPAPARPSLEGQWLFAPSASTHGEGYYPEYIELRLSESSGVIHGSYQARYRVTDRAISPAVNFHFEGRTGPEGGVLPWQGPGGAQGEVTLRLLSSGRLEVDWVAHRLGRELGLISGASTLVRRLD